MRTTNGFLISTLDSFARRSIPNRSISCHVQTPALKRPSPAKSTQGNRLPVLLSFEREHVTPFTLPPPLTLNKHIVLTAALAVVQ